MPSFSLKIQILYWSGPETECIHISVLGYCLQGQCLLPTKAIAKAGNLKQNKKCLKSSASQDASMGKEQRGTRCVGTTKNKEGHKWNVLKIVCVKWNTL